MNETMKYFFAPILVAIIVGGGSAAATAYVTVKVAIARILERVSQVETTAKNNREDIKNHIEDQFEVTDRLARIETKINHIKDSVNGLSEK